MPIIRGIVNGGQKNKKIGEKGRKVLRSEKVWLILPR